MPLIAKTTPKLTIAVDNAPPYGVVNVNGEVAGVMVDIIRQMQRYIDFKLEYVACPFLRCLTMLEQNKVDIMGGLIRTKEREQVMQFVVPPYMILSSSFVFYARSDSEININQYHDLLDKKIAVMRGAAHFPKFDNDTRLNKVEALSEANAFDMLLKQRVDLVIAVEETADHSTHVLNRPAQQFIKMPYRFSGNIYGHMAFSKQFAKTDMAEEIIRLMQQFARTGQLTELVKPYNLPAIKSENVGL
ncbi:substrate-binding periplasmic protein [Pseudoalteromonas mariniglutinosa]|uniref:substrate-binding periplasmic protein n=1 Tax=Pseudoalteromonas mariniglutinosa TaxID=206042 RepID=UPI0038507CA6